MSVSATRVAPWEDLVLRLIACWKLLHAVFFTAVGFGLLRLKHHDVVEFLNTNVIIPYHLNPEGPFVDWMLIKAQALAPHLALLGWTFFFYAALFAAEGIGLLLRRHWAEYLVVIVTGSLLPLEIYELFHKFALWKVAAVSGNLLIVAYLLHRLILDARTKAQLKAAADGKEEDGPSLPPASNRSQAVASKVP